MMAAAQVPAWTDRARKLLGRRGASFAPVDIRGPGRFEEARSDHIEILAENTDL